MKNRITGQIKPEGTDFLIAERRSKRGGTEHAKNSLIFPRRNINWRKQRFLESKKDRKCLIYKNFRQVRETGLEELGKRPYRTLPSLFVKIHSHTKPVCTSRPDLMLIISTCFPAGWGIGWDTTHESGC